MSYLLIIGKRCELYGFSELQKINIFIIKSGATYPSDVVALLGRCGGEYGCGGLESPRDCSVSTAGQGRSSVQPFRVVPVTS